MPHSHVVVMVTVANRKEAEKIANHLLNERLIACVNILGPVSSIFRWSGKVERVEEHILLMKSRLDLFENISDAVTNIHDYEVPEIIALPIIRGFPAFMKWLDSCLRQVDE